MGWGDLAESPPLPAHPELPAAGPSHPWHVPGPKVTFLDPQGSFPNLACDFWTKLQVTPLARRFWRDPQVLLWVTSDVPAHLTSHSGVEIPPFPIEIHPPKLIYRLRTEQLQLIL